MKRLIVLAAALLSLSATAAEYRCVTIYVSTTGKVADLGRMTVVPSQMQSDRLEINNDGDAVECGGFQSKQNRASAPELYCAYSEGGKFIALREVPFPVKGGPRVIGMQRRRGSERLEPAPLALTTDGAPKLDLLVGDRAGKGVYATGCSLVTERERRRD